jgi:heme/copper-type cytochrome/quinol oxidase subunit 2
MTHALIAVYLLGIIIFGSWVMATRHHVPPSQRDASYVIMEVASVVLWPVFSLLVAVLLLTNRARESRERQSEGGDRP